MNAISPMARSCAGLLCLMFCLGLTAPSRAAGWIEERALPVLGALEAHPDSGLLALAPLRDRLLQLSPTGELWHSAGSSGRGMGSFRAPNDMDTNQGLQILKPVRSVLDEEEVNRLLEDSAVV